MEIEPIFLWSDALVYLLFLTIIVFILWARKSELWQEPWSRVCQRKLGMMALVFVLAYSIITLLDSIHFRYQNISGRQVRVHQVQSLLDVLLKPLGTQNEATYSAPFSLYASAKTTAIVGGKFESFYPRLRYAGRHIKNSQQKAYDIIKKVTFSLLVGLGLGLLVTIGTVALLARHNQQPIQKVWKDIFKGRMKVAWREILIAITIIILVSTSIKVISPFYHMLGTDKIGNDILYVTIKSIRTGLIIGTLTTLVMLPFAIFLGTNAGYYSGWRDDIIQYTYTTLSSVPAVLLISAVVLSLQVFISNHPKFFPTLESRADARLLALCFILGITSWTSLCRLIRAETLKLREMDYVKASMVLGIRSGMIILRHIVPNVMHIILITVVIDFSSLVLAEAVLSYVGVGVDPITPSWGNMINSARLDLAREPVVWWPLFAAFVFMFVLVLSANLFADAVRDAFEPRLRHEE